MCPDQELDSDLLVHWLLQYKQTYFACTVALSQAGWLADSLVSSEASVLSLQMATILCPQSLFLYACTPVSKFPLLILIPVRLDLGPLDQPNFNLIIFLRYSE